MTLRNSALPALGLAVAAAACGPSSGTPFPKEAAAAPPVPAALETATFSLG